MDELKSLKLDELAVTTVATTTVGSGVVWLFRDKVAAWVRKVTHPSLEGHTVRLDALERRMQARETHDEVQKQVLENLSRNVQEGFERVTKSIEKLDDRILDLRQ